MTAETAACGCSRCDCLVAPCGGCRCCCNAALTQAADVAEGQRRWRAAPRWDLSCGHTVAWEIAPATGDYVWCVRCDQAAVVTAGLAWNWAKSHRAAQAATAGAS